MDFLYEKSTNIYFWINSSKNPYPSLSEKNSIISILGKTYKLHHENDPEIVNQQIKNVLFKTAWFSYRKNFDPIKTKDSKNNLTNDLGWGCVVRAGQMLIFTVFLKFLLNESELETRSINPFCFKLLKSYFVEKPYLTQPMDFDQNKMSVTNRGLFSLQSFVTLAKTKYELNEGSWFRPTNFLDCFEELINSAQELHSLKVLNVFEHAFYVKTLCKRAFNDESCLQNLNLEQCISLLKNRTWDNKVMLNFCMMIGAYKTLDPKYKNFIRFLTENRSFVGMIGGCNRRAYYLVGCNQDLDFYYLDPHYVKTTLDSFEDEKKLTSEYFEKSFMKINYNNLSSSITLSFLIQNKEDFACFWETLDDQKEILGEEFILGYFLDKDEEESDDQIHVVKSAVDLDENEII